MAMAARTILITGCGAGIGRHCALGLAERGWRVFATARSDTDLPGLAGKGLEALRLDYSDPESIADALETVLARTGGSLDALVNNGAYSQLGAVEDLPTARLREQFEANLFGWHELTRRVVPVMRAQGHGRIVQVSSVLGYVSGPYRGAYAASLEALTDALRMELAGTGIDVVLIEPGPIATDFRQKGLERSLAGLDPEASPHHAAYQAHIAALAEPGARSRFEGTPDAVLACLVRALEARRPKPRYRITLPAHAAEVLRRVLPTRMLDRILAGS